MTRVDKLRLADRIRRIEMIGRHVVVRAFVERSEVTGKDGGPIKLDISNMTVTQGKTTLAEICQKICAFF